ncbi:MAG: hypothetical protein KUA37_06535 [Desulfomicrobium sp.]|nr:hypothetical protein [Pseudomonadota bacterium]MBV1711648.1 hypothetical protein [Desulfomicrobium sp.]MBU4569712.1 hypothetical protein [Pseudomonadota bacterium]MBU4595432.1 hypothetical protein [Pseudomonadota bacterium]MBV1718723.1 hypothetical protein [Desulfomicrobium sp.]
MNTTLRLSLRYLPTYGCLVCMALLLLAPTMAQAAPNITAMPRMANISPGTQSPVQLMYTVLESIPNTSYIATSTQGEFSTPSGDPLGTVQRTVSINVVNSRGVGTELLVVPARVIAAAMKADVGQIIFTRTFDPSRADIPEGTLETTLQIVPSPAGEFAIIGLRLEFNQPAPGDAPRPHSGERITVPRNTKGLRAAAIITYNGHGMLRGRWVADGQILGFVTKQLLPGMREAIIASPAVPAFPTYATGLHSVRFEILDPPPAFDLPSIQYFVTAEERIPNLPAVTLQAPPDRDHLPLSSESPPVFSWNPAHTDATYLFRLFTLEPEAMTRPLIELDTSAPVLSARTGRNYYMLSLFDLGKLVTNSPHAWQVQALVDGRPVAASEYRVVIFSGAASELELTVPLRDQGVSGK